MKKRRILVVDDDNTTLKLLKTSVEKSGHEAIAAESAEEGLALFQKSRPVAMVITDYQMPKMKGTELLAKIRKMAPDTVRVMITSTGDVGVMRDAINQGEIFRFLTKPVDIQLAKSVIEEGVRAYEKSRSTRSQLAEAKSKTTQVKYLTGLTILFGLLLLGLAGWFVYNKFLTAAPQAVKRASAPAKKAATTKTEVAKAPASPLVPAQKLMKEKKFEEALAELDEIIKSDAKNKAAINLSAEAFLRLRRFTEAKKLAEASLRLDPGQGEPYTILAQLSLDAGNLSEAKNFARQAITKNALLPSSFKTLATIYMYENRNPDALKLILEADRLDNQDAETKTLLSSSLLPAKKYNDALKAAEEAVKLDPEAGEAYFNMTMAYYNLNDGKKALEAVQNAERIFHEKDDSVWLSKTRLTKSTILKKFPQQPESNAPSHH
jgi:FixJ family two-component response regulator/Flp pilus assembly protein TadD